jgi:hypothetical protein
MKTIFTFLLLFTLVSSGFSQCEAYLNFGGVGSDLTVEFVASGATNAQYILDWGDGTVDTSSTPLFQHSYTTDGQFVLFYTYQDLDNPNCSYSSFDSIIITGGSCSMNFTVQTIGNVAALEAFSSNTSIPIYTIEWGDGSPTEVADAALHTYASPGNYLVCVQMIDADPTLPCELYECQNIEITGEGSDCEVVLEVAVDVQTATATITGNGGPLAEYIIDWGDGSFDSNPIVEHTYSITNFYNVCVYYGVDGNSGCQTSTCTEVNIDPFASDCYFDFVPVVNGLDVELQVLAAGAADPEFFFDWGDGSPGAYGTPAIYNYSGAGTYEICGTYTDLSNPVACQINVCETVAISTSSGGCEVTLDVTQNGSEISVVAIGTGANLPSYNIDWGDGSLPLLSSTGTHTYTNSGAFEICATYFDELDFACTSTVCETVVVTSVEEARAVALFNARPVPMEDWVQIDYALITPGQIQFRLMDATGRIVEAYAPIQVSNELQTAQLDVSQLPSGVYFLECSTDKGSQSLRLIK